MRARTCLLAGLLVILGDTAQASGAVPDSALALRGVDVSSLARGEEHGLVLRDRTGMPSDPLTLLRDHGVNTVRLRAWVEPPGGWCGLGQVAKTARRAEALGLAVLLDLHFSDGWADPGRQEKPAAWRGLAFPDLEAAVAGHARAACESLLAAGVTPRLVQLGNEVDDGLLWPDGRASIDPDRTARLLAAAAEGVRAASPTSQVMLHVTGRDTTAIRWLLDALGSRGVTWDMTGISYYPRFHGDLDHLAAVLAFVARRYERPVVVVETAYPFTLAGADAEENVVHDVDGLVPGIPATPAGQAAYLARLAAVLRHVPGNRARGFVWWEGTWLATPGNGWDPRDPASGDPWENQALFDFTGRPLPALEEFRR